LRKKASDTKRKRTEVEEERYCSIVGEPAAIGGRGGKGTEVVPSKGGEPWCCGWASRERRAYFLVEGRLIHLLVKGSLVTIGGKKGGRMRAPEEERDYSYSGKKGGNDEVATPGQGKVVKKQSQISKKENGVEPIGEVHG